jgi:hypothetical protein
MPARLVVYELDLDFPATGLFVSRFTLGSIVVVIALIVFAVFVVKVDDRLVRNVTMGVRWTARSGCRSGHG